QPSSRSARGRSAAPPARRRPAAASGRGLVRVSSAWRHHTAAFGSPTTAPARYPRAGSVPLPVRKAHMTAPLTDTVPDVETLRRRIDVALGRAPGDLLLKGGHVVNVFTGRVEPADVVVADGWVAGVGPFAWTARETTPLNGQFVIPGLIDSHMHLESTLLTPAELARLIVPHGTTSIISDSHEIGNVLGIPGIDMLLSASVGLPLDLFFMASACVPATKTERAGPDLGLADV